MKLIIKPITTTILTTAKKTGLVTGIRTTYKNRLTLIKRNVFEKTSPNGRKYWLSEFLCSCGKTCFYIAAQVQNNSRRSCGCIMIDKGESSIINAALSNYMQKAAERSLCWKLSYEEAIHLMLGNCYYCDLPPRLRNIRYGGKNVEAVFNGIDRLNNTIGYIINNCVSCCKFCNISKMNLTVNEFLENINRIVSFQSRKHLRKVA